MSRSRQHLLLTCISMALLCASLQAQESSGYGIYGSFGPNVQSADFRQLPGVPSCCPRYEEGSGPGISFGLLYRFPLSDMLSIDMRAGYSVLSGVLTTTEQTMVLHEGVATRGEFEHRIDATLATIGLSPSIVIRLPAGFSARVGVDAGLLTTHEYEGGERIVQPDGAGTFLDADGNDSHSRVRNLSSGEIPDASSLQLAILGAIAYDLPLNADRTLILSPEAGYSFGITSIAQGLDWSVHQLRFGASIRFLPAPSSSIPPTVITSLPDDSPDDSIAVSSFDAQVRASGLSASGAELPVVQLVVEEFASTLMTPLLTSIFFGEGESTIPSRYISLAPGTRDTFAVERINSPRKLDTYHHLLNIIGRRMLDSPDATITLTGCNQDIGVEKGNSALSLRRAQAVRSYLSEVWGIDTGRVRLAARDLPENAANSLEPDGAEENRRVEITSNRPAILAPVVTRDTLRRVDPPSVRFAPRAQTMAGVQRWEIIARQNGEVLRRLAGEGALPPTIDWRIDGDPSSTPRSDSDITYELVVTDATGRRTRTGDSIPVEQMTIHRKRVERRDDREIDRSSVILFDIRSSEITDAGRSMLPYITTNITPTSTVTITGYTDRLGDESYNQSLSDSRAESVARTLGTTSVSARGLGEADLYDSSLPEGRLYARTVEVVVETPVKK